MNTSLKLIFSLIHVILFKNLVFWKGDHHWLDFLEGIIASTGCLHIQPKTHGPCSSKWDFPLPCPQLPDTTAVSNECAGPPSLLTRQAAPGCLCEPSLGAWPLQQKLRFPLSQLLAHRNCGHATSACGPHEHTALEGCSWAPL